MPPEPAMNNTAASISLSEAEKHCRSYLSHYENFPLKSVFFPREKYQDLANVYAFCRYSDDLGDEGGIDTEEGRIDAVRKLDDWAEDLSKCPDGIPEHPILIALQKTIGKFDLPLAPFLDLISAFRQDQVKLRCQTFEELLNYCQKSANPVGRIYLMLFGIREEKLFSLSDKICTALQLANFWQDVSRDYKKGRIYIPLEDFARFGYTEKALSDGIFNRNFQELMIFESDRTYRLFKEGSALENFLDRRLKLEIRLFRLGGETVLRKISAIKHDVINHRPVISKLDKAGIFLRALTTTWFR